MNDNDIGQIILTQDTQTTNESGQLMDLLDCDGSTFNSAVYPILNTVLGTTTLPDISNPVDPVLKYRIAADVPQEVPIEPPKLLDEVWADPENTVFFGDGSTFDDWIQINDPAQSIVTYPDKDPVIRMQEKDTARADTDIILKNPITPPSGKSFWRFDTVLRFSDAQGANQAVFGGLSNDIQAFFIGKGGYTHEHTDDRTSVGVHPTVGHNKTWILGNEYSDIASDTWYYLIGEHTGNDTWRVWLLNQDTEQIDLQVDITWTPSTGDLARMVFCTGNPDWDNYETSEAYSEVQFTAFTYRTTGA